MTDPTGHPVPAADLPAGISCVLTRGGKPTDEDRAAIAGFKAFMVTRGLRDKILRQVRDERLDQLVANASGAAVEAENDVPWWLVIAEELHGATVDEDPAELRRELIRLAACAVAWVEDIDSRATQASNT